jgi:hypothetical protein
MFSKLPKDSQKIVVFMIMLLILTGTGALVFMLLEEKRYDGVMIVSTVVPSIIFCISTWLYLRINWVTPDVFASNSVQTEMAAYKRKILGYVSVGLLLGIPAVYFIMKGVTHDLFATIFPIAYIFLMSVYTIAFLPGYLKVTGAISPVRYLILTVSLCVIILKVGIYLDSYFPGVVSELIAKKMFFALGCANMLLVFMLHAAWHQVFTVEQVVVIPLNQPEKIEIISVPVPDSV